MTLTKQELKEIRRVLREEYGFFYEDWEIQRIINLAETVHQAFCEEKGGETNVG